MTEHFRRAHKSTFDRSRYSLEKFYIKADKHAKITMNCNRNKFRQRVRLDLARTPSDTDENSASEKEEF